LSILLAAEASRSLVSDEEYAWAFLERCTITAGGRLIHHVVEYIEVLPNQRPYPNTPGLRCVGSKRASLVGDLDTGFHGTIKFYR
jgi:hypothetical protein